MNKPEENIKNKLDILPDKPGVYQFFNINNEIIYIGKAKNVKKRVSSYFHKAHFDNNKLKMLVRNVQDIQYIVVESEGDALLLENNLIKKYQPKYNVQLKDDKSFPWICIKNEPFPRIFPTRNLKKDGSLYFGPYTSMYMVRTLLGLVRKLYPLRSCNFRLTQENIKAGKFKACLEYHIGNCKAPCTGQQDEDEYNANIQQIKQIIKGNIASVVHYLKTMMQDYASNYQFEEAQLIKEKIDVLNTYKSKSTIVNPSINNVDVFSIKNDTDAAYINYLRISNGAVIQSHTVELKKKLNESEEELLHYAIFEIRSKLNSNSDELIVPFEVTNDFNYKQITIPKIGDKKKLLDLSFRNASYFKIEKQKNRELLKEKKQANTETLEKMKEDLRLNALPNHMECFDNSNIQGMNPVAACVTFRNARPAPKEYRHYNVKSVSGPDDYGTMEEVVYRRYTRILNEKKDLPDLIIIDGGKGQLGAAKKALKQLEIEDIPIISIAKRLEEIYFPNDPVPLYLDKNSVTLKVIQHLRNEAHRFGIKFHRNKRSGDFINSEILQINGIGESTRNKLMERYKTIPEIKKASREDLAGLVGKHKAAIIHQYFHPSGDQK